MARMRKLTILLTHIGLEKDRELAAELDPGCGVNLIIGGHSHTFMEEPEVVNSIPIVQAGTGSSIIGRLDLVYDAMRKNIQSLKWSCVPVNEKTAPKDEVMEELQFKGKDIADDMKLKIALQNYHYSSFDEFLGVPLVEVKANGRPRVVAVSLNNIVEEYFATHDRLDAHVEGRIELVES